MRTLLVFAGLLLMLACTKTNEEELQLEADLQRLCSADSVKFNAEVMVIINSNCMPCHNNDRAEGGITLVTYDDITAMADNGSLLGTMRHESGFAPMPASAPKINDCYIKAIETWISNGKPNN